MAQSIFLGPAASPADSVRRVEEKLNAYFAEAFAALSVPTQREILRLTVSSDNGQIDSIRETQRKINRNLSLIAEAASLPLTPVALNETYNLAAGLDPSVVQRLNSHLSIPIVGGGAPASITGTPPDAIIGEPYDWSFTVSPPGTAVTLGSDFASALAARGISHDGFGHLTSASITA